MYATCGSTIYICYKKYCVEWIYNAELHYSLHNARIYSGINAVLWVTQKVLVRKKKKKTMNLMQWKIYLPKDFCKTYILKI